MKGGHVPCHASYSYSCFIFEWTIPYSFNSVQWRQCVTQWAHSFINHWVFLRWCGLSKSYYASVSLHRVRWIGYNCEHTYLIDCSTVSLCSAACILICSALISRFSLSTLALPRNSDSKSFISFLCFNSASYSTVAVMQWIKTIWLFYSCWT